MTLFVRILIWLSSSLASLFETGYDNDNTVSKILHSDLDVKNLRSCLDRVRLSNRSRHGDRRINFQSVGRRMWLHDWVYRSGVESRYVSIWYDVSIDYVIGRLNAIYHQRKTYFSKRESIRYSYSLRIVTFSTLSSTNISISMNQTAFSNWYWHRLMKETKKNYLIQYRSPSKIEIRRNDTMIDTLRSAVVHTSRRNSSK